MKKYVLIFISSISIFLLTACGNFTIANPDEFLNNSVDVIVQDVPVNLSLDHFSKTSEEDTTIDLYQVITFNIDKSKLKGTNILGVRFYLTKQSSSYEKYSMKFESVKFSNDSSLDDEVNILFTKNFTNESFLEIEFNNPISSDTDALRLSFYYETLDDNDELIFSNDIDFHWGIYNLNLIVREED